MMMTMKIEREKRICCNYFIDRWKWEVTTYLQTSNLVVK